MTHPENQKAAAHLVKMAQLVKPQIVPVQIVKTVVVAVLEGSVGYEVEPSDPPVGANTTDSILNVCRTVLVTINSTDRYGVMPYDITSSALKKVVASTNADGTTTNVTHYYRWGYKKNDKNYLSVISTSIKNGECN